MVEGLRLLMLMMLLLLGSILLRIIGLVSHLDVACVTYLSWFRSLRITSMKAIRFDDSILLPVLLRGDVTCMASCTCMTSSYADFPFLFEAFFRSSASASCFKEIFKLKQDTTNVPTSTCTRKPRPARNFY